MPHKPTYAELEQRIKNLEKATDEKKWIESAILNCISEQIVYHNPDMTIGWANEAASKACGIPAAEMKGKHCYDVWHQKANVCDDCHVEKAFKTGLFQSGEIELPDSRILSLNCYPVKNNREDIKGVVEVVGDITERKRIESRLKESEEQFRLLFETMASGFTLLKMIYNKDGKPVDCRYMNVNPAHGRLTGLIPSEIIGKTEKEVFGLKDEWIERYGHVDKTGNPIMIEDYAEGLDRWFRVVAYRPKPGFVAVTFDNITDLKHAEEEIKESEERYRTLYEHAPNAYFTIKAADGSILRCNRQAQQLLGYDKKAMMEMKVFDLYADTAHGLLKATDIFNNFKEGKPIKDVELQMKHSDGHPVWISLTLDPVRDANGTVVKSHSMVIDISERKNFEAQLQQAHKMEAIGTLAGGIAHDFNNILGIIIGNTELAIMDVPEWNPAKDCLKEIRAASMRAKDVVRHILSFARKTPAQRKPIQISTVIKDSLKLMRASIPTTIEIRRNISCTTEMIRADSTEINQVLMNLCTNSLHAMEADGDVLEVSLESISLDKASASRYEDLTPGNFVKLTVKDTGQGIDPEVIDRVFDPYFTTKDVGKGTGMGLAVAFGIVKKHDGAIKVSSEVGKGTVVEVLFPLIEGEGESEVIEEPQALPTGTERILFVDDEESLLKMAKQMLERLGYEVVTKTNPKEALALFGAEPDKFDLVITDMAMPQMAGDRLAQELMEIRKDIPVVLCTGHSARIDEDRAKELGLKAYVMKPLVMRDLAETVRKVLDPALSER